MSLSLLDYLSNNSEHFNHLYIGKNIPKKKIIKAIKSYGKNIDADDVIALFDDTIFGSASEGFLITENFIVDYYNKNKINLKDIKTINSSDKKILINNNYIISPIIADSNEIDFLCNTINAYINDTNSNINTEFKQEKDLKTLLKESNFSGEDIYTDGNLPDLIKNYLISLDDEIDNFSNIIPHNDIIALITTQNIDSYSSIDSVDVFFVSNSHLFYKGATSKPHIFNLSSIKNIDGNSGDIYVKLLDGDTIWLNSMMLEEDRYLPFVSIINEYVEKYSFKDYNLDHKLFENHFYPPEDSPTVTSRLISGTTDIISNNPLFKVISLLNGKSIIIVAFLRNNAPERVLKQLQKLPGVGIAAGVASLVLGRALNWLNNQIMKYGESYMMEQLVANFKKRGVTRDQLEKEVNSNIYTILGDDIVEESISLLNKYMPIDDIDNDNVKNCDNSTLNIDPTDNVCSGCGTQNKIDAKFCSNCGTKLIKEYKCSKCGYSQQEAMKFCPECGNPI